MQSFTRVHVSLFALALLAGSASARQAVRVDRAERHLPPRNAGTFDLVTGVLTPPTPIGAMLVTPGTVYDNTCPTTSYAQTLNGETWIDDGRLPSTTSPAPAVGTFDRYRVTSMVVGYATRELDPSAGGPGASIRIRVFEDYDDCGDLASGGIPVFDATLNGLPGSATQGTLQGILLTINLAGGGEFEIQADANGVNEADQTLDGFGYALTMLNQTGTTLATVGGFIMAGDLTAPGNCAAGDATYYQNAGATAGTGLDNDNFIYLDTGVVATSGCGFFASPPGPHAGLYFRLTGDLDDCNNNAQPDAFDIDTGTSADNNSNAVPDECEGPIVQAYCTSSTTSNGCVPSISGTGAPSVSAASGFTIAVSSVEGLKQGILFYGINNTGFTPNVWGVGSSSFLCVKPPTQRMGVQNSGGTANQCDGVLSIDWNAFRSANPSGLGSPFAIGDEVFAQAWFRDPPAPKTTNLSNGLQFTVGP